MSRTFVRASAQKTPLNEEKYQNLVRDALSTNFGRTITVDKLKQAIDFIKGSRQGLIGRLDLKNRWIELEPDLQPTDYQPPTKRRSSVRLSPEECLDQFNVPDDLADLNLFDKPCLQRIGKECFKMVIPPSSKKPDIVYNVGREIADLWEIDELGIDEYNKIDQGRTRRHGCEKPRQSPSPVRPSSPAQQATRPQPPQSKPATKAYPAGFTSSVERGTRGSKEEQVQEGRKQSQNVDMPAKALNKLEQINQKQQALRQTQQQTQQQPRQTQQQTQQQQQQRQTHQQTTRQQQQQQPIQRQLINILNLAPPPEDEPKKEEPQLGSQLTQSSPSISQTSFGFGASTAENLEPIYEIERLKRRTGSRSLEELLNRMSEEELLYMLTVLHPSDLLELCSKYLKVNRICSQNELWRLRLERELPEDDFSAEQNPRRLYQNVLSMREDRAKVHVIGQDQYPYDLNSYIDASVANWKEANPRKLTPTLQKWIDETVIPAYTNEFIPNLLENLNALIPSLEDLQRGDIAIFETLGDELDIYKFIYNGEQFEPLTYVDENVYKVPITYPVIDEFPIMYWSDIIKSTKLVYFNPEPYMDEILDNIFDNQFTSFRHQNGIEYGISIIGNLNISDDIRTSLLNGIFEYVTAEDDVANPRDYWRSLILRV